MAATFAIPDPPPPRPIAANLVSIQDLEIDALLGATRARAIFNVDGSGLTAAVLDTGLRRTHKCFAGRVPAWRNFTSADPNDVTDTNGHGTNVAGLIAAGTKDEREGIAPGARLVPLKVLPAPTMDTIVQALEWAHSNAAELGITVVNMSLGVPGINWEDDVAARAQHPGLHAAVAKLNAARIPVVVAAGNDYKAFEAEGMSMPGIFREAISVGAVYDASVGIRAYASGAVANSTHADQITPFSQRLSVEQSKDCYTDVFSAGGGATSAGAFGDDDTSMQDGTSQAAPTVAGVVLLLQEYHKRLTGKMPEVALLQDLLRSTSTWLLDGDDEDDNVRHTNRKFPRVNAYESLVALDRYIKLHS